MALVQLVWVVRSERNDLPSKDVQVYGITNILLGTVKLPMIRALKHPHLHARIRTCKRRYMLECIPTHNGTISIVTTIIYRHGHGVFSESSPTGTCAKSQDLTEYKA